MLSFDEVAALISERPGLRLAGIDGLRPLHDRQVSDSMPEMALG
jgi:hypothetical protein